jgi:hypothetical protein
MNKRSVVVYEGAFDNPQTRSLDDKNHPALAKSVENIVAEMQHEIKIQNIQSR